MRNKLKRAVVFAGQMIALMLAVACAQQAEAQTTASGTLHVTATVQSSITLTFLDNANVGTAGFCPLTNPGTNAVGLDLGQASFSGGGSHSLACVGFIPNVGGATYEVNSAFDVLVNKANTNSLNYRLQVSMSSVPTANVTWLLNNTTLTTAAQTLLASASYGKTTTTLRVRIKNSVAAGPQAETIFFTATAN